MYLLTCLEHGNEFIGIREAIEHIRAKHVGFIRRPGRPGECDTHGHTWYCFDCESRAFSDHRSYDSDRAMWNHLKDRHIGIFDYIVEDL